MDFWLCFTCPTQFCELLPGDLGGNAVFLQNLIDQTLDCLRLTTVVIAVELDFLLAECVYSVRVHIRCDTQLSLVLSDLEAFKLETEAVVSRTMLQCFWKVNSSEY